jgi:hypothetical protein
MATGFLITASILILGSYARGSRRMIWITATLVLIVATGSILRFARHTLHDQGTQALTAAVEKMVELERTKEGSGEGAETATSSHEFSALTLECITLYESGNDRHWRSVYLPVLYTLEPQYFMSLLGLEREKEAAWEIREHFISNGAIAVFGEAYWNGGYLGVILIISGILLLCYLCDRNYRHSFVWLILYCNFAPLLLQGVGYGISYEVRGLVNGLLQLALYRIAVAATRALRRAQPSSGPVHGVQS